MSPQNDGAAREVQAGRLRGFEGDDPAVEDLGFSLPPRPSRTVPASVEESPDLAGAPAVAPAARPAPDPGTKGTDSRVRASNVHIPVTLLEPIAALKRQQGLSNGDVIICAIEQTYPELAGLIQPAPQAGGTLFAARHARVSRSDTGPLTPFNYRLREQDYTTLDRLVEEFGANSRSHLITVALTAFFRT